MRTRRLAQRVNAFSWERQSPARRLGGWVRLLPDGSLAPPRPGLAVVFPEERHRRNPRWLREAPQVALPTEVLLSQPLRAVHKRRIGVRRSFIADFSGRKHGLLCKPLQRLEPGWFRLGGNKKPRRGGVVKGVISSPRLAWGRPRGRWVWPREEVRP